MLAARLAPVVVALLVLGAHFFRAGAWVPLVVVVALIALMPLRRRWVPWLVQAALVLGAIEWVRTLADLVVLRQAMGMSWVRMAVILGGVSIATVLCALVFRARRVRAYYDADTPIDARDARPGPGSRSSAETAA